MERLVIFMFHSFDIDIAKEYGVNEAIILYNIAFWVDTNRKNDRNLFDGRYWTYNSAKAFQEQFPYMSVRTIQRVIKNLIDNGLILSGKFSSDSRNRTNYYTLTDYGASITIDWRVALRQNGNTGYDKLTECLFNKNTNSNTDINDSNNDIHIPPISPTLASEKEKIELLFADFWKAYPKKVKKQNALREFKKIKDIENLMPVILADIDLKKQSKDWTKENGQYIPDPERYIKNERWNDVNEIANLQAYQNELVLQDIQNFNLWRNEDDAQ